jgi:hypothetical protein
MMIRTLDTVDTTLRSSRARPAPRHAAASHRTQREQATCLEALSSKCHLHGQDTLFLSYLIDGFDTLERFQRHTGFEFSSVCSFFRFFVSMVVYHSETFNSIAYTLAPF